MEITAKAKVKGKDGQPDTERVVSVTYDFGDDLDQMVEKLGKDVVYGNALDSLVISVQAMIRRHAAGTEKTAGKSDEDIQKVVSAWKPGVGTTRKSSVEKAADLIGKLSPEEKKRLLAELRH